MTNSSNGQNAGRAAPLSGVTVLEIGHSVAAPFAGLVLANLGARVVKVEQASGDPTRQWGPPFTDKSAVTFEAINREKHSIVADLRDPDVRESLASFIQSDADVVLQNLRFGALERLQLGPDALLNDKPQLIYCTLGAYGKNGPLKEKPGYDPMVQAASGVMSLLGEDGDRPSRIPGSVLDMSTGLWAVIGILSALHNLQQTGRGGEVDASLYESALSLLSLPINEYLGSGEAPRRLGSSHSTTSPSGAFQTSDGWVMLGAGNDKQFAAVCKALNAEHLMEEPEFASNPERVRNRAALYARLDEIFPNKTSNEWIETLTSHGVPCSPINDLPTVLDHPQTKALDMVQRSPDGAVQTVALPIRFDGARNTFKNRAPDLGEHTSHYIQTNMGKGEQDK